MRKARVLLFLVLCLHRGGWFAVSLHSAERIQLEVRETSGIRRFGYPVSAELHLEPPVPKGTRFRLLVEGAPVPAQFRGIEEKEGRVFVVALDFEGSFLPWETRKYEVEHGSDVTPGPEPGAGLKLEETDDSYKLVNGPAGRPQIVWEVRKDLAGLLQSVKTQSAEYIAAGREGLFLRGHEGKTVRIGGSVRGRVVKEGPFACRLRFESAHDLGGSHPVASAVELEVPRSKSWVRIHWRVDDAEGRVTGLAAQVRLALEGQETCVDFGADGLVYAALREGQAASLRAGFRTPAHRPGGEPHWEVLRGTAEKLEPYVSGGLTGTRRVDGWAHVMDRTRCTAVAVAAFGKETLDRMDTNAAGELTLSRELDASETARRKPEQSSRVKGLLFWIHFVDFPPHVGAVTSPQSMASPLETRVTRP